jgi:hypothetical protein
MNLIHSSLDTCYTSSLATDSFIYVMLVLRVILSLSQTRRYREVECQLPVTNIFLCRFINITNACVVKGLKQSNCGHVLYLFGSHIEQK